MAIRRYDVVDPSDVEEFQDRVLRSVTERKYLSIKAVLVPDELSRHRRKRTIRETFTFRITDIHNDPQDFSVLVQDMKTLRWSTIVAIGNTISFEVVS